MSASQFSATPRAQAGGAGWMEHGSGGSPGRALRSLKSTHQGGAWRGLALATASNGQYYYAAVASDITDHYDLVRQRVYRRGRREPVDLS